MYSAKLVGYDYVWFFVKKFPHTFLEGERPLFFGDGAQRNIYPIFVMILISRIYGMERKHKNHRKYQYKHFMCLNAKNWAFINNLPQSQKEFTNNHLNLHVIKPIDTVTSLFICQGHIGLNKVS